MKHSAKHDLKLLFSPEGSVNIIEMTSNRTQRLFCAAHGTSRLPSEQPELNMAAGASIREEKFSSTPLGSLAGSEN